MRTAALCLLLSLFAAAVPPARLRPNLRGEVMILVYHNFGEKDARWTRAFSSFDQDLDRLDAAGYRPITLRQYVSGDFALPAGTSPVVLTFDDSSKFQFRITPEGGLAPDSAVTHWVAFAKTHPEFPVHGTFFINPGTDVFGQRALIGKKLRMLVGMGSEIGNHTWDHPNLAHISPTAVQREVGLAQYKIDRWIPGYRVTSLALPFGVAPKDDQLVVASSWTGNPARRAAPVTVRWNYNAVVLVGSGPAPSPLVAGLHAAHLPRIQVFSPEFNKWMAYFERYPGRRFVSDGARHASASLPRLAARMKSARPRVGVPLY